MDNVLPIILTSIATLIVTVLGGLALEYLKRIKPKLVYEVTEAIPIKFEDKVIGANVITVFNPSSKIIKDVVIKITTTAEKIQDGGTKVSEGLEYFYSTEGQSISITIPFMKSKESLTITTISEGRNIIPEKPAVTIRSPELFKLIDAEKVKEVKVYRMLLPSAAIASATIFVILTLTDRIDIVGFGGDQSSGLAIAAASAGLPKLTEQYALHRDVYFYTSGPLAYSLARDSSDKNEIVKYRLFLQKILELSDGFMRARSECALYFYLGKIDQLLNDRESSQVQFMTSEKINKKHYKILVNLNETNK